MGALILDANVLIALLDRADSHHAKAVDDVEAADQANQQLVVPASAYSEALVAFARAGRLADARRAIAAMGISIAALTAGIAEEAAELRAKHAKLRLGDAVVLAAARSMAGELLTYDQRLKRLAVRLNGGGGRDSISGGGGRDTISARDRTRDRVNCGSGRDRVTADRIDLVSGNCERVSR